MINVLARAAALNLTFPTNPEDQIVFALTWAPTLIVGLVLCIALLILLARHPPPGDDEDSRAPGWFRLLRAAMFGALMQALMAGIIVLIQTDAFTAADPTAQYPPRGIVLGAALFGLLAFFPDPRNSARVLARGRARLVGPLQTPVIGLLTPKEERTCTAYGRITGAFLLMLSPPIVAGAGLILLARLGGRQFDAWPLLLPFLLCWSAALLAFLMVAGAMRRLNRRSLTTYCLELVTLGRKWVDAVDAELRLEGLGLYQRVADLADALGKDRLMQAGRMQTAEAVAESRLVLAQASLEPGGEGLQEATAYLVGAIELRDLKPGEWLGLGWLLASDYVPPALLQDRARYGHLLLSYCRAWVAAQRQLRQKTPLSAAVRTNVRLGLVVTALERRVCALAPDVSQAKPGAAGNPARSEQAPWRSDTFLADLAARPDVRLLLALNEAMLQLDATLAWARVNSGLCRLALGDAATARAHLEVAASQRRDDPSLPFYRAVAYAREQQTGEALALLEELTQTELGWFLAVRTYAETLLEVFKMPLVPTTTGGPGQAINADRWKRALAIIERALTQESLQPRLQTPGAAPIYVAAGMAELFGRQQPAQADVWFRRALGVERQNAEAWYGLALACWEQAQMEATLSAAQEALRYQPQHVPAATLSAQVLMVRGEMAPALAMADQALRLLSDPRATQMRVVHHPRLSPEYDVLLRVKGRAAFEQGRFAEAFAALDQVVRRYVDARFFAACALFHLGRYAQATERLKDYLTSKEGERDGRAFLYLGCALHAQGQQHQRAALNALDACLALPKLGTLERLRGLLERGQIHEEREELEAARQDYEAALEIERKPLPMYVLAALYHRMGRDEDAYTLLAPLVNEQAPAGAAARHASGQLASPRPVTGRNGGPGGSSNTIIFVQGNEPVEAQIQRLFEILRERLAEQASQAAASSVEPPEQTEAAPVGQEEATTGQTELTITPEEASAAPEDADSASTTQVTQAAMTGIISPAMVEEEETEEEQTAVLGNTPPETPPDHS